jgi:hypothetical protein
MTRKSSGISLGAHLEACSGGGSTAGTRVSGASFASVMTMRGGSIQDVYEELIDAGDHVVSVVTTQGRGRVSGAEVEMTHAGMWTVHQGKVVRVVWLGTREEALKIAGLEV